MTQALRLQPRLQLLADLVPLGARLADVGTDHGYLPVYLLQKGHIRTAIATDIGEAPLEHARQTARQYGVEDSLRFLRCDGLDSISPEEVDTVVIAGMGGETIIHVLSNATWTKNGGTLLLLQPMTKQEELRRWLSKNGYAQYAERLVRDKDYLYPVFTVFGGARQELSVAEIYGGVDIEVDPLAGEYLDQKIHRLTQAADGLRRGGGAKNVARAEESEKIIRALAERRDAL